MQVILVSLTKASPSSHDHSRLTQLSSQKSFISFTIQLSSLRRGKEASLSDDSLCEEKGNKTAFCISSLNKSSRLIAFSARLSSLTFIDGKLSRSVSTEREEWTALFAAFSEATAVEVNAVMMIVRYDKLSDK